MAWYIAKLLVLLPLLGLLIWGSLKLTKHLQGKLSGSLVGSLGGKAGKPRAVHLVETCFLGPGLKIAVVEFRGREILLGCSRNGLTRLSEREMDAAQVDAGQVDTGQSPESLFDVRNDGPIEAVQDDLASTSKAAAPNHSHGSAR
jgi:flagellar protein FliO/FliZ